MMNIFVFGNPDLEEDSLPIRILPSLKKSLPHINFSTLDPHEEWEVPEEMTIIDTVVGIENITTFSNLNAFMKTPRVTCHDYDAYTNLQFLVKLGKVKQVTIIGIPTLMSKGKVLEEIVHILRAQHS